MDLQGLLVIGDRLVGLALLAGGGGLTGETFEAGRLGRRRTCLTQEESRRNGQQEEDDRDKQQLWSAGSPVMYDRVTHREHSIAMERTPRRNWKRALPPLKKNITPRRDWPAGGRGLQRRGQGPLRHGRRLRRLQPGRVDGHLRRQYR